MNNPFYPYPGYPLSGYHDYETYLGELVRLYDYVKHLKSLTYKEPDKIHLHITIGAAAEEIHTEMHGRIDIGKQWQQLMPKHLVKCLEYDYRVIHLIISPNRSFRPANPQVPLFVLNTPKFDWKKIDNSWYSKKYSYEVHIFNTPMPSEDIYKTYPKIIEKMRASKCLPEEEYARFVQTEKDIEFIHLFYRDLKELVELFSATQSVTCYSFATFLTGTEKGDLCKNYYLFREILKVFGKLKPNKILAEWQYKISCEYVEDLNGKKITYIW